jgi:hypothetical protein
VTDARVARATAVVTVVAGLLSDVPWTVLPPLILLGWLASRGWVWAAPGLALVWGAAAQGPWAGPVVGAGLFLAVLGWRPISSALLALLAVMVARQFVVLPILPGALGPLAGLVLGMLAATAAASAARGDRAEGWALWAVAAVVSARLVGMWAADGQARLDAAIALDAEGMVYPSLMRSEDPALLRSLVRAVPGRDEAALGLGWEEALALGWRPVRAEGVEIAVARALEERGRGGEALRLLRRLPRLGDIDAILGLLERIQGEPVRWKGAPLGELLPGSFDPNVSFETNGYARTEFTAVVAADGLIVDAVGQAWRGPAVLEVTLDGEAPRRWELDGEGELAFGPLAEGPHRLGFRFVNDLAGPGGDRNVRVTRVGTR